MNHEILVSRADEQDLFFRCVASLPVEPKFAEVTLTKFGSAAGSPTPLDFIEQCEKANVMPYQQTLLTVSRIGIPRSITEDSTIEKLPTFAKTKLSEVMQESAVHNLPPYRYTLKLKEKDKEQFARYTSYLDHKKRDDYFLVHGAFTLQDYSDGPRIPGEQYVRLTLTRVGKMSKAILILRNADRLPKGPLIADWFASLQKPFGTPRRQSIF